VFVAEDARADELLVIFELGFQLELADRHVLSVCLVYPYSSFYVGLGKK